MQRRIPDGSRAFLSVMTLFFLTTTLVSCGQQKQPKLASQSEVSRPGDMQMGYTSLAGEIVQTPFIAIGDMAYINGDTAVPRDSIASSMEGMHLTTEASTKLWPGGVVPYLASPDIPKSVLDHVSAQYARAGIRLVPWDEHKKYVVLETVDCIRDDKNRCTQASGISSDIGLTDPVNGISENRIQIIKETLKNDSYLKHVLLHELGHALGCRHEHAHPDAHKFLEPTRDWVEYAKTVKLESLWEGIGLYDYKILATTSFDFNSVMLYCDYYKRLSSAIFAPLDRFRQIINLDKPTICKPGQEPSQLSAKDVEGLKKLYEQEIIRAKLAEDKSGAGFIGFTTGGKFRTATLIDEDSCSFGSLPPPDGIVKMVAYGKDNQGIVVESTRNYATHFPLGSVMPLWVGLPTIASNTVRHLGPSGCNNGTGFAVRVVLSN